MTCRNCGNTDAYEKKSFYDETGVLHETCNECKTFEAPTRSLDETERVYRKNFPAATAERLIANHRIEKIMNQKRYPIIKKKNYE